MAEDPNTSLLRAISHQLGTLGRLETIRYIEQKFESPRYSDAKRLTKYGFKVYSQTDEDGIIEEIFRRIGTTNKSFIEFGVESGIECNTAKLLVEGWNGVWLEGAKEHIPKIVQNFHDFFKDDRLRLSNAMVTAENINALLREKVSSEIDLLSIDIDGNDYW